MKKRMYFLYFLCFLLVFTCLPALLLNGSELGNKNLKGVKYIITALRFNGVSYGEGYTDPKEETIKEFNLKEAAAKLEEDGIPMTEETIRKLYAQMDSMAGEAGVKVVKAKTYSDEKVTLIPTLTAGIDIMSTGKKENELYIAVVHLTLTKWLSNWSGTQRILAPVYTWSEKKMTTAGPGELVQTVETSVSELMKGFLKGLKEVNREEKPEEVKKS